MTAPISDDVRAIEEALAAGPTEGEWLVTGATVYALVETRGGPANRFTGQFQSARQAHEALLTELAANAELCAAANPARLRRVLDTLQAMGEALTLAEDVLARFPFSTEIWPNGTHPNAGITQIRDALALYEGKQ